MLPFLSLWHLGDQRLLLWSSHRLIKTMTLTQTNGSIPNGSIPRAVGDWAVFQSRELLYPK
jgi:hypothetical protein